MGACELEGGEASSFSECGDSRDNGGLGSVILDEDGCTVAVPIAIWKAMLPVEADEAYAKLSVCQHQFLACIVPQLDSKVCQRDKQSEFVRRGEITLSEKALQFAEKLKLGFCRRGGR